MEMIENGAAQHRPFMILMYRGQARLFFILDLTDEKTLLFL
jgi:hypothetical protein